MSLDRSFWSGYRYSMDGSESERVHNFWGLYNSSFTELMSQQPDALAEAKKAEGPMYASLGVTAVTGIYAFSQLFAATETDNPFEQDDRLTNAMGVLLAGVIVNAILQVPIRNHLFEAVGTFNEGLDVPEDESTQPPLAVRLMPNSVELNPVTNQIGVGWRFTR